MILPWAFLRYRQRAAAIAVTVRQLMYYASPVVLGARVNCSLAYVCSASFAERVPTYSADCEAITRRPRSRNPAIIWGNVWVCGEGGGEDAWE